MTFLPLTASAAAAFLLAMSSTPPPPPPPSTVPTAAAATATTSTSSSSCWLRIIQINDVYELDNFPSLKTLIREKTLPHKTAPSTATTPKDDTRTATIVVCAGDFLAPSLLSSLDQGGSMVDCFNAVGVTHVSLGNHEADVSTRALMERWQQSDFCWINSNLRSLDEVLQREYRDATVQNDEEEDTATTTTAAGVRPGDPSKSRTATATTTRTTTRLPTTVPYSTVSVGSKTVALLGLLTDDPSLYRPGAFGDAVIDPVLPTAQALLDRLSSSSMRLKDTNHHDDAKEHDDNDRVDLIIPLTHQSIADDRVFAQHQFSRSMDATKHSDADDPVASSCRCFPVVLGGHDHEVYTEVYNGCHIVKAGMDAVNAAVIDIQWPALDQPDYNNNQQPQPTVSIEIVPTSDYAPDPDMLTRVRGHQKVLCELEKARLFCLEDWIGGGRRRWNRLVQSANSNNSDDKQQQHPGDGTFSTVANRLGPSSGTTALATMLRMGMRAQCAIVNAGAVRGNKVYYSPCAVANGAAGVNPSSGDGDSDELPISLVAAAGATYFTWSDLKAEMPFTTGMTACLIPGAVLEATIAYSRRNTRLVPPKASGGYLHTCNNIVYDDVKEKIISVQAKPFKLDQIYLVALPVQFFNGIDNHKPLLEWAKQQGDRPSFSEESARPAKMVLVEVFSSLLWLQLGSFDEIDTNSDGVLHRQEVRERVALMYGHDSVADLVVDSLFSVADMTKDDTVTRLEMMIVQFVATDIVDHVCTNKELRAMRDVASQVLGKDPSHEDVKAMVERIRETIDLEGDGTIHRAEVMNALGTLKRSDLLR